MTWDGSHPTAHSAEHAARRERVLARDSYVCQIRGPRCIGKANTLDHILAIGLGGPDTDENCQAACGPCNQWKASREGHEAKRRTASRRYRPPESHPGRR